MIPPLKDEVENAIPTYVMQSWKQRKCGNKCLWSLYRIMRIFFVSIWFFFIPFVALTYNFIVPYVYLKKKVVVTDGSSMDEEY